MIFLQEGDMLAKYEPLTMKQTKSEMINAYNELLKKLEEKAASGVPEKKAEQKKKAEKDLLAKVSTYTIESIVKDLADLHLNVGKALSDLIEAQLVAKGIEAEQQRVAELKIKTLETTVNQQEEKLQRLMIGLADANEKVQNIAVKAIEGASGARTLSAVSEIALEQAKKPVGPK
jgi:hypothetical protein